MNTPTQTPTRTPVADRPSDPPPRETPAQSGNGTHAAAPPPIVDFPLRQTVEEEAQEGENEYVVDVETHVSLLVQATTPETAAAKAVLHTIDPEEDGSVAEVARSVHTCLHSGLDESDACDQHGEHNEE